MSMIVSIVQPDIGFQLLIWSTVSIIVVGVAVLTGIVRLRAVAGPSRLAPGRSPWLLLFVLFMGFMVWISIQILYGSFRQAQLQGMGGATHPAQFDESMFSGRDWAFLSTIPPLAATLALLGGDLIIGGKRLPTEPSPLRRLGLRNPVRALWLGFIGICIAWPLVQVVSGVCEWVYARLHYAHPMEHDLLRVLGEQPSALVKISLIAGATLVAPLFEELLFRGHIQTLIRSVLMQWTSPRVYAYIASTEADATQTSPSDLSPLEYFAPAETTVIPAEARPWQSWLAIVIASALFALVHPGWMRVPIFCLSLCLGYAYERSQNLWVNIVMHASFNLTSTLIYLFVAR